MISINIKAHFMRKIFFIVLLASTVHMVSCQNSAHSQEMTKQSISVDEFDKKLSVTAKAQLIDVRTPEEYTSGHLRNAVNIDYNSGDFEDLLSKLDKSKPVLVYCLSGGRSSHAANKMQNMGFTQVYNMDGGIMKWNGAGKPIEKGSTPAKSNGMTMEEFNEIVGGGNYVLVDYNAKWCEPCKKMLPILESVAEKRKDKMSLIKVDADANKELMKQKGISSLPYLELYKGGKLVWKHEGFIDEDQLLKETGI
jgi:thioredoxin 1